MRTKFMAFAESNVIDSKGIMCHLSLNGLTSMSQHVLLPACRTSRHHTCESKLITVDMLVTCPYTPLCKKPCLHFTCRTHQN